MMQQAFDFLGRAEVMLLALGVAVFLMLFWVVRGAPIGQKTHAEPGEAPSSAYRDRVVALAIVSFLIILGGAFVAGRFGIPWSVPFFAAGFGLILTVLGVNRSYRHISPTLRRVVEFANAALNVSLIGGILIVANVFAFRFGGKPLDFTHDEAFTLSSLSTNQVASLDQPLKFTLVMGRNPQMIRQRDRVRQLIDLYRSVNPSMVSVDEIIAFSQAQATDYEALVKRVPELPVVRGDAVVIELGEGESARRAVLGIQELFRDVSTNTKGDDPRYATAFGGEDQITSTLVRFREGKRVQVAFTTGHREPSITEMDTNALGLGLWRSRLASLGTESVEINLLSSDVPTGIAVLIVVAPRGRFQDQEITRIKAHLSKGGPLLVVANGLEKTGIEEVLALHNIEFEPGVIVDPVFSARARITSVFTPPLPRSEMPIVESLAGQNILVPEASPLHVIGSAQPGPDAQKPKVNPAVTVLPFLRTGPQSWAESDRASLPRPQFDKATDRMGPLVVGMAASERAETAGGTPRPRLVVFSSELMATNPVLASDPANTDLLNNAIGWLRGKSETIGMAPKVHTAMLFTADPNLRVKLLVVPTVISVVLIVGFGLTTYLARRS